MKEIDNYYDPYRPNEKAAAVAAGIFAILTIGHIVMLIRTRTWFCIAFIIGAIFEIVGYVARGLGRDRGDSLGLYVIQTLAILLAPILFAASVYMFLGRIIRATGCASYSMIRTTWLTKIFVGGDIVCFLIQGLGGSILATAKTKDKLDLGKYTILAGLILQIVIFGLFMIAAVIFHVRVNKKGLGKMANSWNWQGFLIALYVVSVIITIRNLFRTIEYVMGKDGYLLTHEWPIYAFDGALMAIVLAITAFWYVGDLSRYAQIANVSSREGVELIPGSQQNTAYPGPEFQDNTSYGQSHGPPGYRNYHAA
ncbi:RTA1-domain-containing protein [Aaosphaeria arxii CBS 175.79]|uniref:RTA1-domain-containing protein n=1 Tax=Aaosphaeria arxii CBS 175.79 TaxID=1450172 RepID=A0A6A5Y106_9PLEO|nr:RTA1-domain-containing protein [Aaosphaeria arxii CBS 175.79]KAF2019198.1 RTA1-domain-containing protein [Aaosphaeria arxii CBS 175.79]